MLNAVDLSICSTCKNERGDRFLADPLKVYIFHANNFIYVLQKKH